MKSLVSAAVHPHDGPSAPRRPLVRLLGLAPALLLLSGLLAVWAGPLAAPAAAAVPSGVVVAWGDDESGQTDVPAGLSGVTTIAAGGDHSLALKSDGTVVAWGLNDHGQSTVPAGLSGVTAIAAGPGHSLALKSDGTVVAWGCNDNGQTDVPAGLSGVTAIAAGGGHSLALKSNGTVVAWGDNTYGQARVPFGLSDVSAIAAGYNFSIALKSNGTVVAWGSNSFGETSVPAGLSGVTAIAAGGNHSLALKADGTVVAWGYYGPAYVPAGNSGVTAIAVGEMPGLALKSNGTVVAWGDNSYGETDVPPGLSGVIAIAAGDWHSLALVPTSVATLAVSGVTTPRTAGWTGNITVTARDAHGNTDPTYRGKVHFTSTDPQASLPANYTFTAADAGSHVFVATVILKTAGTQSVSATDTVARSISGTQSGTVVSAAALSKLVVSGLTTPRTAGTAGSIQVTATDPFGNRISSYRGTIHFTSTDAAASLPANYAFVAVDAGSHTFSVTLKTAGTWSVTATDTATASITGTQTDIVVNAAALAVYGMTTPRVADSTGSIRVTALEANGKRAYSYRGTIQFTSSDPDASLPSNYTFTAADAGTHVFFANVILRTAGTWSVSATDTMASSVTGVQSGIIVTPHVVTRLLVYGMTTPRMAASTHSILVSARDVADKRVYGYRGTVHFTSTDPQAYLPADYTFKAADNGYAVVPNAILQTPGTWSVTATDTSNASITGTQSGIVVNTTPLLVSGMTTPRTAGSTGSIRVTAVDVAGDRLPSYLGTIHFTSTDLQASLPADYTFTAADAGTHVFVATVILKTVGTWSVTATDTATASITSTQAGIVVTPAAVSKFVVSGFKEPRSYHDDTGIRVTATDAYGNRIHGYLGTIHFTSSDAKAHLPPDYTFTTADAGTHVFMDILGFGTAGTQSVTATDTANPSITGSQTGIVVHRPLVVSGLTTPRTAGSTGGITVTATDQYGYWNQGYRGTIHFTSTDPKATLPPDYTFTAAAAGRHVFSGVILKTAGTWSVTATDTANPSITGSQTGIVVN